MTETNQEHRASVAIIGLGLIGGSLGLVLREAGYHVSGFARNPAVRGRALALGAVDLAITDLSDIVDAEIIVLAVPVLATPLVIQDLIPHLAPGAIVTDVASTKRQILLWASNLLPDSVQFVGGHPMAGKEKAGIEHADIQLFRGRTWCIVAPDKTHPSAVATITQLAIATGALPFTIDALSHDAVVAATSHLPFLAATALADATFTRSDWASLQPLASSGLRDTTRLASGDALMHRDICASNHVSIVKQIDQFLERLGELRTLIHEQNDEQLLAYFERLKTHRDLFLAYLDARAEIT